MYNNIQCTGQVDETRIGITVSEEELREVECF